jgi:HAD superfamily hydrolase (TIGR01509 family)
VRSLEALICDVGGVLVQTHDRTPRSRWAARLGISVESLESLVFEGDSGRQAQLGRKSAREHWAWLGTHFQLSARELAQFFDDFFSGDRLNQELLAFLHAQRRRGIRLVLLSNYFDDARKLWETRYGLPAAVDRLVVSSEIGVMKPEPAIYRACLDALDLAPAAALFLDDNEANVDGARRVGMHAVLFTTTAGAIRCIEEHLHRAVSTA